MLSTPFYDPERSYEDNFSEGPFGYFAEPGVTPQKGEPQYDFFGHKVYSPFGIPAGPLINGNFTQAALDKGFDIVIYKTVRTRKYPCHPWPNVLSVDVQGDLTLEKAKGKLVANHEFHEPLSITNSFGVPSPDPEFWQQDIARLIKAQRPGQIVVGGFQGTKVGDGDVEAYIEDYRVAARMLKDLGIQVFEVNLSCPNEGTANLLCFDIERSALVVRAIKEIIGDLRLMVKVAYFQDQDALRTFVQRVGSVADGISAINTIATEIVDENGEQALPGEGRARSGVCGHSIKWAGLEMVKRLKALREELGLHYTITGVGGVTHPEDFLEYRSAGADVVMSATGAMWNPHLAEDIKKTL